MTQFLTLAAALVLMAGAAQAQRTDLVVGMQLEPPNLDPTAGAAAAIDEVVYANVFEGLTRFANGRHHQAGPGRELGDRPRWPLLGLPPPLRRELPRRHPSSTAEDVVFSFDRAMAEDSTNAQKQLFAGINEVTAIDHHRRDRPRPAEGFAADQPRLGRRRHRLPRQRRHQRHETLGTGPFKFSNWVQGDRVELVKTPTIGASRRSSTRSPSSSSPTPPPPSRP